MAITHTPDIDDVIVVAVGDHSAVELARDLIGRGHRVAVAGTAVGHLVPLVAGHADTTMAIVADLTDPAQVRSMIDRVERRLGPITVMTDPGGAFGSTPWRLHTIGRATEHPVAA
ncbi:hypothetical protein [Williamsia phyllosphaerae]|uniref:Short chain dehydrogenase n=1 Tax=Williamsia phyllosphaerae TaxID=885042 RepID=A0ABQ1V1Z2_9NOCA|nr:hypothetical protein [Williamsia phyllosphaerae]GGF32621.1 hypothetical protein GCM10007298_30640 [Williamsia phyllosphaerae]